MTLDDQIQYIEQQLDYNNRCLNAAIEFPPEEADEISEQEVLFHKAEIFVLTEVLESLNRLKGLEK